MSGTAGTAMACGYCGRPCASGVWIGHQVFHPECTRGPSFSPQARAPFIYPHTLGDIRRIVREEIERAKGDAK